MEKERQMQAEREEDLKLLNTLLAKEKEAESKVSREIRFFFPAQACALQPICADSIGESCIFSHIYLYVIYYFLQEQAYKKRLSDQAREYRRQLEMLMAKEAESEAFAESIRAAEQEKVNPPHKSKMLRCRPFIQSRVSDYILHWQQAFRKREIEWEREREYRQALMREVLAVRKEQLEEQSTFPLCIMDSPHARSPHFEDMRAVL